MPLFGKKRGKSQKAYEEEYGDQAQLTRYKPLTQETDILQQETDTLQQPSSPSVIVTDDHQSVSQSARNFQLSTDSVDSTVQQASSSSFPQQPNIVERNSGPISNLQVTVPSESKPSPMSTPEQPKKQHSSSVYSLGSLSSGYSTRSPSPGYSTRSSSPSHSHKTELTAAVSQLQPSLTNTPEQPRKRHYSDSKMTRYRRLEIRNQLRSGKPRPRPHATDVIPIPEDSLLDSVAISSQDNHGSSQLEKLIEQVAEQHKFSKRLNIDSALSKEGGEMQSKVKITGNSSTGNIRTTGYLRGAEVVAETDVVVTNEATSYLWERCGFKLNVPKNSLLEGFPEYPVNIKASLTGHFELPEGLELVSAVYWVYVPGKFTKPATIEVQHCANFSHPDQLHFIHANCTQKSLPYKFEVVDGGSFTLGSKYGALSTTKFSGNGIAKEVAPGDHSCQYCAQVYFTVKHLQDFWYCHFVVTKDLDMCLAVVQRKYQQDYDIAPPITFGEDHITLDIPEDGTQTSNGWRIAPQYIPVIYKERVNSFSSEQSWVPECVLLLEWLHKEKNPDQLEYKVKMLGAKEKKAFFRIFFHPENFMQSSRSGSLVSGVRNETSCTGVSADEHSQITTSSPTVISSDIAILDEKPRLAQLTLLKTTKGRVQIIDSIAPQWKRLGILMDFDDDGNRVDLIANEYKQDGPVICCQEVFKLWLKGTNATWRNLIDLLNDCEMEELVQEIKSALGLPSA